MPYSYDQLQDILRPELCPLAFVDLAQFDANLDALGKALQPTGKKIRLGTKSVRVPALVKRALERDFVNGLLIFHPNEVRYFREKYDVRDFLLAYPIMSSNDARILAGDAHDDPNAKITVMVDAVEHLELLEAAARVIDSTLHVCIEVSMAASFLGQYAGVMRSPLETPAQVVALAQAIQKYPHLQFRGIMGYEAQNASIGDDSFLMRKMKAHSREVVDIRRDQVVSALKNAGFPCEIVNGGGSGCFQDTAAEATSTEIGVGSALFKSYIFDSINSMKIFNPSLFMALRVVRRPRPNVVTAFSGGYICSGSNRPPKVVAPAGVQPTKREGWGEVQTPFNFNPQRHDIKLGDLIICRFAKAGEPLERINEVLAISDGRIIERYPTYRGVGLWAG